MSLAELSETRVYELKCCVYYALDTIPGNEMLEQSDLDKINAADTPAQIPMSILEKLYEGYNFVDEDFCNA